ncbi:MAG: helix-turn-helix domain-containing protein, partial [Ktedonobacteraceae bacterium]|nr:helix-turn-helix domain-containing protein [Ktedonobacteraceae bacterium]
GMRYIVDILRGANTQKIRDLGHNQLSTYGIGRDLSAEEWLRLGRALLQQGLLSATDDGYPVLRLNKNSVEILRQQRRVEMVAAPLQQKKVSDDMALQLRPEELGLFQHLRNLRKELADEQMVPPYVIFPDSSLQAMARQRPQSEDQFARIPGVGDRKLEAYFTPFSRAIQDYCDQHNLEMGLDLAHKAPKKAAAAPHSSAGPSTRQYTLDLYREGRSIEEIAEIRNLKPSTIVGHLSDLIEAGETIRVDGLIQPGHYQAIINALQQVEGEALKPVKELLGDDYSYEEIRLARALLRRPQ